MRSIRICVLATPCTANAGVWKYWQNTVEALRQQGVDVTVLLGGPGEPIEVPKLSLDARSVIWIRGRFRSFLRDSGTTHLITSMPQSDILVSRLIGDGSFKTHVFAHGIPFPIPGQSNALKTSLWRSSWLTAARKADSLIAVSPELGAALAPSVGRSFQSVVPYIQVHPRVDATSRYAGRATRLGFVGRVAYEKDPLLFARIASEFPSMKVHVFGQGDLSSQLTTALPTATYHGVVDDAHRIYEAIDVVLITSRSEGLSLVALEAAAHGVVPIASDVGGLRRAIAPELHNDLLIPERLRNSVAAWRNAILRMEAPDERERILSIQRDYVLTNFGADSSANQLLNAIGIRR